MKTFNYTCQGASHITSHKVCQDFSYSESSPAMSIAVVSDGHGGETYFRSDIGAQLAVQIAVDCIKEVAEAYASVLQDLPFAQMKTPLSDEYKEAKQPALDNDFQRLFKAILTRWNKAIENHWNTNPVSDEEKQNLSASALTIVNTGEKIEKAYGCTLIAALITDTYWFAFQIGDGRLVAFSTDFPELVSEPIPWDEKCFLNKTTSLCDSEAGREFRYCYGGKKTIPFAVFMGSDGIDDTWHSEENLYNYYIEKLKLCVRKPIDKIVSNLQKELPTLSEHGSKDDMSVAAIVDSGQVEQALNNLVRCQIKMFTKQKAVFDDRIKELDAKIQLIHDQFEKVNLTKTLFDLQNLQKDRTRQVSQSQKMQEIINSIAEELTDQEPVKEIKKVAVSEQLLMNDDILRKYNVTALRLFGLTLFVLPNRIAIIYPKPFKAFTENELELFLMSQLKITVD